MNDENDIRNSSHEDDEVSLVDLVVVLIRHRKIIIIPTLCAIGLSLVMYFGYPAFQYKKMVENQPAEVTAIGLVNSVVSRILDAGESASYIVQHFNDPVEILAALREAGYMELDDGTPLQGDLDEGIILSNVKLRFIKNQSVSGKALKPDERIYSFSLDNGSGATGSTARIASSTSQQKAVDTEYVNPQNNGVLAIVFRSKDIEKAKQFISIMFQKISSSMADRLEPFAIAKIEAFESLAAIQNPDPTILTKVLESNEDYNFIKYYIVNKEKPVIILRAPYAVQPDISLALIKADILKKSVLLVFAVAFFSILAAFVIQYIENIRKDPESMAKIHEALKRR